MEGLAEQEFIYRVPWHSPEAMAGNHPGARTGSGPEFHSHTTLMQHPDARHLDLRNSLRDPFGQFLVKRYRQTSSLNVIVVADLSASIGSFGKLQRSIELSRSIAWSACRNGDRFRYLGGATQAPENLQTPSTRQYSQLQDLWQTLASYRPQGNELSGLLASLELLPSQRSLVFLISDFHFDPQTLHTLLSRLEYHDVVPLVLWDEREYQELPEWRFVRLNDPESGKRRTLWLRPKLKQQIHAAFQQHQQHLITTCAQFGRDPVFIQQPFNADQLTDYFLGGG